MAERNAINQNIIWNSSIAMTLDTWVRKSREVLKLDKYYIGMSIK